MFEVMPNMFLPASGDGEGSSRPVPGNSKMTDSDREQIALDIRRYLKIQLSSTRRSLSAAYRIGVMLNMVHDSLNHGEWMPWLEKNTRIKIRTANQWRTLADHRDLVIFGLRNKLSITEVLALISELRTAKSRPIGYMASRSKVAADDSMSASKCPTSPEQSTVDARDSRDEIGSDRSDQSSSATVNVIKQIRRYLADISANADLLELASVVAICETFVKAAKIRIEKEAA